MSFRQSISRFRKKAKDKLSKIGHKLERRADVGNEEFARSALSLQSEPWILVERKSRGGDIRVGKVNGPQPDDSRSVLRSAVGIGHSQGGIIGTERPPPSTSRVGETESTWTGPFQSPLLTDNVGSPTVPGPVLVDATVPKDKPDWKHTVSSAAKLLLRTVERASDAFPPLKSAAAGLCAILDNCEVCFTFVRSILNIHGSHSK